MRRLPVVPAIICLVTLLGAGAPLAAATKKLACLEVLSAPGADLDRIARQLDPLIRENLARIEGVGLLEAAPVAQAVGRADRAALLRLEHSALAAVAAGLGADLVLASRIELDQVAGKLRIIGVLLNGKDGTPLDRIVSEESFSRQNQLIGLFVNQLHLAVRSAVGDGGSEFSETAFSLDVQRDLPAGARPAPGEDFNRGGSGYKFQNKYTLSILFDFQMPLFSLGGNTSTVIGADFIVELEDNFYAFGTGIQVLGTSYVEFRAVAEFHFLRILPEQVVQVFLRTTPGFLYPITADGFAFRMANAIGTRFRFGSFLLDASVGLDFRSNQTSSLLVGIGSGMRF